MKKILHIADTNSIDIPGGIETVIRNCLRHPPAGYEGEFINSNKLKSFSLFRKVIPSKSKIFQVIEENSPQVIHFHGSTPFIWLSIKMIKRLNLKIVLTPFFHQPRYTSKPFLSFLNMIFLKLIVSSGVKMHFCSNFERGYFNKTNDHNTFIFPPFFISNEKLEINNKKDILFVGRDDRHKGLFEFIEVSKNFPKENFVAVTKPRNKIDQIKNLQIQSNVSDYELDLIYEKTKVLIFPSAYESFGGVFLEALSKGCMVICSNMILGTEFFSKNENLHFYKYSANKTENVKQINCLLDKIITKKLSFKKYTNNDANRNSIKIIEHINSYNSLYI